MSIRRPAALILLLAVCIAGADDAHAQWANPTMQQLKAAFLFNFTKFSDWPSDVLPAGAPMVLCVAADQKIRQALETLTKAKNVKGHPIAVQGIRLDAPLTSCHLLYVEELDAAQARQLLQTLNRLPVLSVSDFKHFAQIGGSIQLFTEGGRMRFAVNVEAVERSKVRVSSMLLGLAKIVKDDSAGIERW